jgi:soluble lytic murein transglycosylase-like protein
MAKTRLQAGLAALFFSSVAVVPADAANLCEREMVRAARLHDVPLGILYAVGLTETGRRGSLQPYALNIDGRSVFATTLDEALAHIDAARKSGAKAIDIGCMQINHRFHADRFKSVREMLDPKANVDYAARFLKQLRMREKTWTLAAARYNAGPDADAAQKRYVCQVIANLVASGFGSWTANATAFCQRNDASPAKV